MYEQIRSACAAAVVAAYPAPIAPSEEAPTAPLEGGTNTALPEAYQDYADVFLEEAAGQAPTHSALEHHIELEDGALPSWGPIYPLSLVELETFRAYLEDA